MPAEDVREQVPETGRRARGVGARGMSRRVSALVKAQVSDPELVALRRDQIVRAAVKLFSEQGYYNTTIQQVAREAGISTGLVYQYFRDKDDILLLTLKLVLDTYEQEIPPKLAGVEHPVDRLCTALGAYCEIVDGLREATVLAYRSTKSLRADRRAIIKDAETRTNRIFEDAIRACIEQDFIRPVNAHLLAYSQVMYCHAWALKHWAFRDRYGLKRYVAEGVKLLVEPFLTDKGRAVLARLRSRRTD
jgi:AcrR family transcriptional regulator